MKSSKLVSLFSLSLLALSAASYAAPPYHGGYHGGGGYGAGEGAGFIDGLAAALATSYSILTTDANQNYDSETLLIEAANYEDTGVKGPVFSAFSQQMVAEMGKQIGTDKVAQADPAQLDAMIADRILQDAK